jgi:hypothetical protein
MKDTTEVRADRDEDNQDAVPPTATQGRLTGTDNQVAWAEQIRSTVHTEFDRVASALEARGGTQSQTRRSDTIAMIGILEEKRAEVMAKEDAGYFIREWQELRDQVRLMVIQDPRFKAMAALKG